MPQQPGGAEPRPAAAPRSGLRPAPRRGTPSSLVNRNVFVGKRRTSLRLEPAMWDALAEICRRENRSLHDICALVDARRRASSLTAAIRVYILNYFRAAATEEGHAGTGHGPLYGARPDGRLENGLR